ncbi:hypothetical protein F4780DRAFT_779370 [Xylariomycetidae sp. FL0641]|nr:hypothetical protein F4780DRAFT_779370 [Xylariomycetidae sp. FL0641]
MFGTAVARRPFADFSAFVEKQRKLYSGRDVDENEYHYVPRSALKAYWDKSKVAAVLHAYGSALQWSDIGAIRQHYLQVFSVLVYIQPRHTQAVQYLSEFEHYGLDDDKLPFEDWPSQWPQDPAHQIIYEAFVEKQWSFFPLRFENLRLNDRHLHRKMILPIKEMQTLKQGTNASIREITVNQEQNSPGDEIGDRQSQKVFVLKTYHNDKTKRKLYDNEREALTILKNKSIENVISLYGCFRQNESYHLILEHANRGSLEDLLDKGCAPTSAEDRLYFWTSLLRVIHGFRAVHSWLDSDTDHRFLGIHEDVKPDNILLCQGESDSPYDFVPKVADFGLFSRIRDSRTSSSQAMGLDNQGNQVYSAPECSRNPSRRQTGTSWITAKADVFSLGAVLSDCCAWVAGGTKLRKEHFKARLDFHTRENTFQRNGYEGCFHDGVEPLALVDEHHEKIKSLLAENDNFTPWVIDMVKNNMLLSKASDRMQTQYLASKVEGLILQASRTAPGVTESESTLSKSASLTSSIVDGDDSCTCAASNDKSFESQHLQGHQEAGERASIPDASGLALHGKQHQGSPANNTTGSADITCPVKAAVSGCTRRLSLLKRQRDTFDVKKLGTYRKAKKQKQEPDPLAQQVVEHILENLGGRDQFFFIDNSTSMEEHSSVVDETFTSLSWLAKKLDPDDVEMSFSSAPSRVSKSKRTKKLAKIVEKADYRRDPTLMWKSFGSLVDNVIIKRLPWRFFGLNFNHPWARGQLSVYIFTDGNWDEGRTDPKACGLEGPLQRLIDTLKSRKLDKSQVSLHFVRFGTSESGKKHLKFLDDYGKAEGWDIVDVKHIRHPIHAIVTGPLSKPNDEAEYDD